MALFLCDTGIYCSSYDIIGRVEAIQNYINTSHIKYPYSMHVTEYNIRCNYGTEIYRIESDKIQVVGHISIV